MNRVATFSAVVTMLGACTGAAAQPAKTTPAITSQEAEFFETKIRPVLAEHCFTCHGPNKQQAGLRLDAADALRKGSDAGPVLVPGDPDKSTLIRAVRREGEVK